jgi:hypothetical protein
MDHPTATCQTCAYLILSESSPAQMCCGWNYYRQPPSLRVVLNHNHYKSVESQHSCEQWQRHTPSEPRDEFHKISSDMRV